MLGLVPKMIPTTHRCRFVTHRVTASRGQHRTYSPSVVALNQSPEDIPKMREHEQVVRTMDKLLEDHKYQRAIDTWQSYSASERVKPNVFVLNSLMKAYLGLRDLNTALKLLEETKREKLNPNLIMYTNLLVACKVRLNHFFLSCL